MPADQIPEDTDGGDAVGGEGAGDGGFDIDIGF